MKKSILVFTILLFLFSVNLLARMQEATEQFGKTESTLPKIVKSAARPSIPEGKKLRSISRLQAALIDENYVPVNRQSRDGVATVWSEDFETEHDLFYYAGLNHVWTFPDEHSDFAVRYSPFRDGTLDGAWIYFNGGTATSVDVTVYADNGSNYPGTVLGTLPYAPSYEGWEYVDLSSLGINVVSTDDFFIGLGNATGGNAVILSDDTSSGTGVSRSLVYDGGWYNCAEYYSGDYEWVIDAMITYDDPWTSALGKWQLQTDPVSARQDTAHSATHCWWADESITGFYKDYLTSPVFTLDADENYDLYNLSLWVDIEFMRSTAGGTSIDEHYEVYIADIDSTPTDWFHIDSFNGYDVNSWRCGSDSLTGWVGGWGYGNSWNQWIATPDFTLPMTTGINLDFMHRHDSEPSCDFCYVEASTDGWNNVDLLASYDGTDNTWSDVNISLDAYAGETVSVRFRFESDTGYSDEDGLYLSEGGWFIDDVVISDASRTIYFQDNADDEVHFIVNQGNFDWTQLFYDYDRDYPDPSLGWEIVDGSTIFNGTCVVTPWAGKNCQLQVSVAVDDSTHAHGAGLYIDDISIDGIALPEFDIQTDFLVVPYPQTEEVARSITTPKIIYHQAGFSTSAPNAACDIEGIGNDYPANDYYGLGLPGVAMGEYELGELQYAAPAGFAGLEAGRYNYKGWCDGATETERGDTFAPDNYVEVYPPGEYELGYNSRTLGNYYYPECTGAVVYYSPFSDGYFTTRDTYEITGVNHRIYKRGGDYGDEASLTFQVYDAATATTFGALLYEETISFAIIAADQFNWVEIPFALPVTVTSDFFIHVTGDFINYPGGAPLEGPLVYSMLVDSEQMFEDELGAYVYPGHNFNYNPTRYALEEQDRGYYINALINHDIPQTIVYGTVEDSLGNTIPDEDMYITAHTWCFPGDTLSTAGGGIDYWIEDGVGQYELDYSTFANPPSADVPVSMFFMDTSTQPQLEFAQETVVIPATRHIFGYNTDIIVKPFDDLRWDPDIYATTPFSNTAECIYEIFIPNNKVCLITNRCDAFQGPVTMSVFDYWGEWQSSGLWHVDEMYDTKIVYGGNHGYGGILLRIHSAIIPTYDWYSGSWSDCGRCGNLFDVRIRTMVIQPEPEDDSPFYATYCQGFWDGFSCELGDIISPNHTFVSGIGSSSSDFPRTLGTSGVQTLDIQFESYENWWWRDMCLPLNLLDVTGSGNLYLDIPDADNTLTSVYLTAGDTLCCLYPGGIDTPGTHTMTLYADGDLEFNFDCFLFTSNLQYIDNLTIEIIGTDAHLTWEDPEPGISGVYNIYRSSDPYDHDGFTLIDTSPITSYVDGDPTRMDKAFYVIAKQLDQFSRQNILRTKPKIDKKEKSGIETKKSRKLWNRK